MISSSLLCRGQSSPDSSRHLWQGYFRSYLTDTRDILLFPREMQKKDRLFAALSLTTVSLAFLFDEELESIIRHNEWRSTDDRWVDYSFSNFGNGLYPGAGALVLYGIGLSSDNDKLKWLSMLQVKTLILAAGFSRGPKVLAQRHRPDQTDPVIDAWNWEGPTKGLTGHYSFTSGHTFMAFSWAAVTASACSENKWLVAGLYTVAGLVGASRVYKGDHWVSDVAAGAVLGTVLGKISFRIQERNWQVRKLNRKTNYDRQ